MSQCIICSTVNKDTLVTLQKISTWEVLLNAATIRGHELILKMSRSLQPATNIPKDAKYHRQCYQQFTNKSSLNILSKKSNKRDEELRLLLEKCNSYENEEATPKAKRSSSSSSLLPNKCILCNKTAKYKNRKLEALRRCEVIKTGEHLKDCTKEKGDHRVLSFVSTHDLIAAEAKYHPSCYADYTRPKKRTTVDTNQANINKLSWKASPCS